jgi:hypothetical protein|nr:MAG TPA: hypothetical protein [Caudoviricetes sp.]
MIKYDFEIEKGSIHIFNNEPYLYIGNNTFRKIENIDYIDIEVDIL